MGGRPRKKGRQERNVGWLVGSSVAFELGRCGGRRGGGREDRAQIGARPIPHCGLRSTGALPEAAPELRTCLPT